MGDFPFTECLPKNIHSFSLSKHTKLLASYFCLHKKNLVNLKLTWQIQIICWSLAVEKQTKIVMGGLQVVLCIFVIYFDRTKDEVKDYLMVQAPKI